MSGKGIPKCAKCGINAKEDSSLRFYRFPLPSKRDGSLRAKVWATFCFPNGDWRSDELLRKLHTQPKMLCGKHFDNSSFTSSDRKRLNKFAIPIGAENILHQLRNKQSTSKTVQISSTKLLLDTDATASTSHFSGAVDHGETLANLSSFATVEKATPKKKGILKDLDIATCSELTPKKQALYKRCRRNLSEIIRLRYKLGKIKKSKQTAINILASNDSVHDIIKSRLSSSFFLLLQSQLKNVPRKLTGRRWTLEDKVLALSIFKKSSSCYRLLSRLFCLPSVSSLKILLKKIPLICGINTQVFDTLKEIAETRDSSDNLCVVAFDEMSIRKNVWYNTRLDQLDGYQDHGNQGRTSEIASNALTFMAIGVRKPWKQPVAFYFSGVSVTADRLAVLIKEVLSACFGAGLIVIGTVCDLDGANIRAINILGSTKEQPSFIHEGHEIATILDPPHLLKCFRNNFLKHNIEFTEDIQIDGKKKQGVAKWSHIKEFYDLDNKNPNFVFAPALTEQHLQPNGKQKMKVRLAAQVLSHSVAAGLYAKASQNELPQDAIATATVVSKIDKLFDAVNGDTPNPKRGKPLLCNMSACTHHSEYFKEVKLFFTNMKFLGARSKPPSQDGWLRTLNAIEKVMKILKTVHNVKTLSVRKLNQDPLENCFGCIRTNCGCNPNPTSVQYIAALKTSIMTNLINYNKNRNCVDDNNNILFNLTQFLKKEQATKKDSTNNITSQPLIDEEPVVDEEMLQCSGEWQACSYVCGFIAKSLKDCTGCKNIILAEPNTEVFHLFTLYKEYNDDKYHLNYVHKNFIVLVSNAANIINNYLKENSHMKELKKNLFKLCESLNTDWLRGCEEHLELNVNKIITSTIAICIKRFCILKNRQYVEEASKKALKRKINILKHL